MQPENLYYRALDAVDDGIFMNAFIPHKLDHVLHFERDSKMLKSGQEANNPFLNIISKVCLSVYRDSTCSG